jgi:acylglycerol lipase
MPILEANVTLGGDTYYERRWPLDAPKGHIVIVHGYGEHCARYDHVAAAFNADGYSVYSYDQRWHGRSPGKRAYIEDFERLPRDLSEYLAHFHTLSNGAPFFIFAHSMGGLVTTRYLQTHTPPPALKGVVFSSPFLQLPDDVSPFLIKLAGVLGTYTPWLPVSKLASDAVSRDPAVVTAYDKDPLNNHGPILARTGAQINSAVAVARANAAKLSLPTYLFHGDADRLAMCAGSQYLHDNIASADKALRIYPGGYHELFNDTIKADVLRDILAWYNARN